MEIVRRDHLVALGADGWLVFAPPLRPGAILLIHANGNEPRVCGCLRSCWTRGGCRGRSGRSARRR